MKIIETKPIPFLEVREVLTKMEKEKELGHEQKITLDYLRTVTTLDEKELKAVREELSKIEGIKDHQIITLVNMLPKDVDEINTLFMKERMKLEPDKIAKIAGIINKARPKEKKK
ncbi:MAG: hypothetical protein ABIG84_04765 [archaeon]